MLFSSIIVLMVLQPGYFVKKLSCERWKISSRIVTNLLAAIGRGGALQLYPLVVARGISIGGLANTKRGPPLGKRRRA